MAKARNLCKKKELRQKYARIVVWNIVIETALYAADIWREGRKKGIENKYNTFFKKCARAITGFPQGSEGNMAMLEADIRMAQAILDERKRRFGV